MCFFWDAKDQRVFFVDTKVFICVPKVFFGKQKMFLTFSEVEGELINCENCS